MAKSGRQSSARSWHKMFRTCLSQVSRTVSSPSASSCARLHTSSTLHTELARRSSLYDAKKANTLIKNDKRRNALEMRPHIVLGHRPGDEAKWLNCDLAKILVSDEELQIPTVDVDSTDQPPSDTTTTTTTTQLPTHLNFGIGETEKELLFRDLPELSAQAVVLAYQQASPDALAELHDQRQEHERLKLSQFAKVVDLKNADAQGIAHENRRRIILAFSGRENSYDTGSTEVQVALLTCRIRNLYFHLTKFRRDVGNRRGLRILVHRRAKLLKYLKRKYRQRYDALLERLGLEPASVEGELAL